MALGDEINQFYLVIEGMVILCKYIAKNLFSIIIGKPATSLVFTERDSQQEFFYYLAT